MAKGETSCKWQLRMHMNNGLDSHSSADINPDPLVTKELHLKNGKVRADQESSESFIFIDNAKVVFSATDDRWIRVEICRLSESVTCRTLPWTLWAPGYS